VAKGGSSQEPVEGLKELEALIRRGMERGDRKSEVCAAWAAKLGIGEDQVHKYLRRFPAETRDLWDQLGDMRRLHNLDDEDDGERSQGVTISLFVVALRNKQESPIRQPGAS
jgi:hypothetical protein